MTMGVGVIVGSRGVVRRSISAGITASTTQTQGQQPLTSDINQISVCANPNDVVTLPTAVPAREVTIINDGAENLQIFPASGDDLGSGVDVSATLEPNESVTIVAFNTTTWDIETTTGIAHAEMTDNENTDAYVVTEQDNEQAYHSNALVAGDLGGGWTFDAGGAGTSHAIDSIADGVASGVDIEVTTSDNHLLAVGDIVSHSNLTSAVYTGHFKVKAIISDTEYEVAAVFTSTDTGTMDQAAVLICPTGGTGTYHCAWSCDVEAATNNHIFDFALHLDETHQPKSNARRKFATGGDIGSISKVCLLDITAGERVSFMVKNTSGSGNLTIRNLNVVLIRL